ncbi:MAG: octaprenyl diphosphate synthase, partial [Pseudoalteromonas sp.]
DNLSAILDTLAQTKALDFTMDKANQEADKAIASLTVLEESPYKEALISLAKIAVDRSH